ncbi:hypothetical protein QTV44_003849 [Vibrio vulnificus]|nr:hypothetical protein [Vibrio vulnificus]
MKYLILLLIFLGSGLAQAEIFVVVSHESSIHQMKQSDVADIYLGRKRIFGQVEITQVLDREDDVRERFFIRIANMRASQINAYWAKLKFSGRVRTPHLVETDEELLSHLLSNPNAIGYMQTLPPDELKVVVTINE